MSIIYSIVNHETKQKVDIGQGSSSGGWYAWIDERADMEALGRFLCANTNQTLEVVCIDYRSSGTEEENKKAEQCSHYQDFQ